MTKERRLGRGLEVLLGRMTANPETAGQSPYPNPPDGQSQAGVPSPYGGAVEEPYGTAVESPTQPGPTSPDAGPTDGGAQGGGSASAVDSGPLRVEIRRIDANPFQPRQDFDEADLESLCDSLRAHGLLQPIVVRRREDRYQLVAGGRRLQAAAKAGWSEVPVQVVEADDRQMAELAIVENMQRKDLNALEKATSFQRYLERYGSTQEELASRLKLDRSTIANLIRLLELPDPVQEAIRQAKITPGHARALLPLGDEREQVEFCQRVQREEMSVRQTERAVQEKIEEADAEPLGLVGRDGRPSRARRVQSEHLVALEQEFRAALGTKVKINHSGRGRGKLVIHFASHEEFERLRRHICGVGQPDAQGQVG